MSFSELRETGSDSCPVARLIKIGSESSGSVVIRLVVNLLKSVLRGYQNMCSYYR